MNIKNLKIRDVEVKLTSLTFIFRLYFITSLMLVFVSCAKLLTEGITFLDSMILILSLYLFCVPLFLKRFIEKVLNKEFEENELKKYVDQNK